VHRKPVWMIRPLGIKTVRRQAEIMETETRRFYKRAANKVSDASTQQLLGALAVMTTAGGIGHTYHI